VISLALFAQSFLLFLKINPLLDSQVESGLEGQGEGQSESFGPEELFPEFYHCVGFDKLGELGKKRVTSGIFVS